MTARLRHSGHTQSPLRSVPVIILGRVGPGDPDRHDYEIKVMDGVEVTPGPVWHSLYRWIISQADEFLAFQTVYLITDNRDLLAATVSSTAGLSHWPVVAAWWKERIRYVGPYGERTTVVFVPISADTGLDKVHPTWAGTYILDACVFLFPDINFALIDSDCVPVTLFEIQELWLSCAEPDSTEDESRQPAAIPSSPIAPAQKRARSVDTGQATQQHSESGSRCDPSQRRPADVYIPAWGAYRLAAFDLAATSGMLGSVASAACGRSAATNYEGRKRAHQNTEQHCHSQGLQFVPLVVEACCGRWGPTASATWKKLGALHGACIGLTASQGVEQLLQALSETLQTQEPCSGACPQQTTPPASQRPCRLAVPTPKKLKVCPLGFSFGRHLKLNKLDPCPRPPTRFAAGVGELHGNGRKQERQHQTRPPSAQKKANQACTDHRGSCKLHGWRPRMPS